jgi:hypothetical protein
MTALITRPGSGSVAGREARYVDAIVELQQTLRFPGLVRAVRDLPDVHVVDHGYGLTTVAVPTERLPLRYQLATAGFRLAQYLRVGYASPRVVMDQALFGEPISSWRPDDVHFLTLDSESGQILGYATLVGHDDSAADGTRGRFPVEQAHDIDLFKAVGLPPTANAGQVREIKRFVHLVSMSDRRLRLRVSMDLLVAIARVIESQQSGIIGLVGDAEAHVALRHLVLMGLRVIVVTGTTPVLSKLDLMHPRYDGKDKVEPFFAQVEVHELQRRRVVLETACASDNQFAAISLLMKEMSGTVERIGLDGAPQP